MSTVEMYAQDCTEPAGPNPPGHGSGGNDSTKNPPPGTPPPFTWRIPLAHAVDPNEIEGVYGYDSTRHWVSIKDQLKYTVRFENDPEFATAPAQNVYLYIPVHPRINLNTLKLGSFGFGRYTFSVPSNTNAYSTRLDMRDSLGLYVDVIAGIDVVKGEVFWTFKSIDPVTGLAPDSANVGFLPVNDTTITRFNDSLQKPGEGFVTFQLLPRNNLLTSDTVAEQASIVFDVNEPILTNVWVNTIDAFAPTSSVNGHTVATDTIRFHWSGQDDVGGTGVKHYSVYVSEGSGPFQLYQSQLADTATYFVGLIGNTYRFFSLATDNVGNKEALKTTGEITVTLSNVGTPLPISWLYFEGRLKGEDALLTWATTSEKNCRSYIVERSVDGSLFSEIGIVAALNGAQTNNYYYLDPGITRLGVSKVYYRLRQVMQDNSHAFSKTVAMPVEHDASVKLDVKAFPNPFGRNISLQIINVTKSVSKDHSVSLYAIDGKLRYRRALDIVGDATILLDDLPELDPGIYMLKVVVNGQLFTIKMTHQ